MSSIERAAARAACLMILLLTALMAPVALEAQGQAATTTFLAIPETYPDVDGPVVVLREPGRNIILLRESEATPEALSVALVLLDRLADHTPLRPGLAHMAPVTGYHLRTPLAPARHTELAALIARLRERPVAPIGNLGVGRSMPLVTRGG
jgi:hypothetical protein